MPKSGGPRVPAPPSELVKSHGLVLPHLMQRYLGVCYLRFALGILIALEIRIFEAGVVFCW